MDDNKWCSRGVLEICPGGGGGGGGGGLEGKTEACPGGGGCGTKHKHVQGGWNRIEACPGGHL